MGTPLMTNHKFAEQMRLEMLHELYRRLPVGAFGAYAVAFLSITLLWDVKSQKSLMVWGVTILFVYSIRFVQGVLFRKDKNVESNSAKWLYLLYAGCFLNGAVWGASILIPDLSQPMQVCIQMMLISGVVAGSVTTYAGHPICMVAFVSPITLIMVVWFFMQSVPQWHVAGVSVLAFMAVVSYTSHATYRSVVTSFSLRFDNLGLVEELQNAQKKMIDMAYRDSLTDLPNRLLLKEIFKNAAAAADRNRAGMAILYIDLNNFKPINDKWGHAFGDSALKKIANIMESQLRKSDVLARIGGDEFVALLQHVRRPEDAFFAANKLVWKTEQPFEVEGKEIALGASIGIALYPKHGARLGELLSKADQAMYKVKGAGSAGWLLYDPKDPGALRAY